MTVSLSRENLIDWANRCPAFHQVDLSRTSSILLAQAYASEINRVFDTFHITQAIKALEDLSTLSETGDAQQFKHPPLAGLYKKHFTSPRFLAKNLRNFLQSKQGKQHFNKVYDEACKASKSGYVDDEFAKYIAHHMVVEPIAIKNASKNMTGEWIVFHKHNGQNFYLTLAFHDETNEEIHRKVVQACEFDKLPFKL